MLPDRCVKRDLGGSSSGSSGSSNSSNGTCSSSRRHTPPDSTSSEDKRKEGPRKRSKNTDDEEEGCSLPKRSPKLTQQKESNEENEESHQTEDRAPSAGRAEPGHDLPADYEAELVLDASPLQLERSLLIHQVEGGEESSSASPPRGPGEESIMASSNSSLVKAAYHSSSLLSAPSVVVRSNQPTETLILPNLTSVFQSEEEELVPSKDEPLSFNPGNSSSPKADTEEEGDVQELLLHASPSHNISTEAEDEPDFLHHKEFSYILDAPTACKFRKNEDPLTYINKDLFYGLSLEFRRNPESSIRHGSTVTSIILMDFREQKSREEALKTWSFWYSRQHNEDVRILDVEYNVMSGIIGQPTELAYNAVSVQWSPDLGNAYVMVAVRCLSTDFSIQKGIKGIPLQLQIDTSDEFGTLISRGVCQVKVFCDKGAERKTREDLKRFVREIEKNNGPMEYCREGRPRSLFKPCKDLSSKPILFIPVSNGSSNNSTTNNTNNNSSSTPFQRLLGSNVGGRPPPSEESSSKRRSIRYRPGDPPSRIMIYVRQDSDDVFTPLHVQPPTVLGLIQAISSKYQIDFSNIRHLYRRDLRGITVKVDDDMLKFYCDEDAFLMKVLAFEEKNSLSLVHDIVLVDLKTSLADIRGAEKDTNNNDNEPSENDSTSQ